MDAPLLFEDNRVTELVPDNEGAEEADRLRDGFAVTEGDVAAYSCITSAIMPTANRKSKRRSALERVH